MNAPDTPVAVVTGANRGIGRAITGEDLNVTAGVVMYWSREGDL